MAKPVKISDGLYEELRIRSDNEGLTLQDALQGKLDEGHTRIAQLTNEQKQLQESLQRKNKEFVSLKEEGTAISRELSSRAEQIERLRAQLQSTKARRDQLTEQKLELSGKLQQVEEEQQQRAERAKRNKKILQTVGIIAAALAAAELVYQLWDYRKKRREERGQPAAPQPQVSAVSSPLAVGRWHYE